MNTYTKALFDIIHEKHELGTCIVESEIPLLIEHLRTRLDIAQSILDCSPLSLRTLDKRIRQDTDNLLHEKSNVEIVRFIRELAAYLGEVLIIHCDGELKCKGNLWMTMIYFSTEFTLKKEGRTTRTNNLAISLGNIASDGLDRVNLGKNPGFYEVYTMVNNKKLSEKLW